jgi:signal transduction histidine kinase
VFTAGIIIFGIQYLRRNTPMVRVGLLIFLCCLSWISFCQIPEHGLQLWLKGDAGVISEKSGVIQWNDCSGNNLNAITVTPGHPQVLFDAEKKINAIRFNGEDTGMQTPAFISFPSKRGTVIVVGRINGPSSTSGIGAGALVSTYHGNGNTWQLGANADKYMFYDGVGRQGYFSPESFLPGWRIITLLRPNDSTIQLMFNGEHIIHHPITNNQPASNTLKIGYNALKVHPLDSVTEVLNGDIAEVIMYDRSLQESDLADVHHYLLSKYSLPLPPLPFYRTTWFYIIMSLLLFTTSVAVWKILTQRKLQKQVQDLLVQKQIEIERQRISREMHDDIGAGLTQIILMADAARKMSSGKELERISATSRTLVSNMSEIIWSLNPENKTLQQLMYYLREQLHNLLEYSGFDYSISLPDNGLDVNLSNEQLRTILLVTKELVNNSIKHSKGKKITVSSKFNGSVLSFQIMDDGCGFNWKNTVSGNGLKNIRHRIQQLGGFMEVVTEPGNGFTFIFSIELVATT